MGKSSAASSDQHGTPDIRPLEELPLYGVKPTSATLDDLMAATEAAERELLVACNALYIATDRKVADDVKAKARAVIEANAAFNSALAANLRTVKP